MEAIRFSYDTPRQWGIDLGSRPEFVGSDSPKRRLLAHALRVDRSLFPELAKRVEVAAGKVGLSETPTTFVANDPNANAMCIPWSSEGKDDFAIMLTSGLINLLKPKELQFVLGHEIGHFVYRHFTYPAVGEETNLGERLATLNLQRAAEISADRMGLMASSSVEDGCSAMIKTACGLGEPHLRLHVPTILAQFRELTNEVGGHAEAAFDTHPLMAIRVRSLLRFSTTDTFHSLRADPGAAVNEGLTSIDEKIRQDFDKASGFSHETWEDQSLARIRLWAVLLLFVSDRRLSKEEQAILSECFGEEHARNAIAFVKGSGHNSPEAVLGKFTEACAEAPGIAPGKLDKLFSEMERIASAASGDNDAILDCLKTIGETLGVRRHPHIAPWEADID
ncbi:M48 family metallopeptidase [bacterium]|nr:M48 family metallopeptidase [bacterium]